MTRTSLRRANSKNFEVSRSPSATFPRGDNGQMKMRSKRDVLLADIVNHDWRQASAVDSAAAARSIPVALRELMSDDDVARDGAYHELTTVAWHQGTLYPVAADSLRFLGRMLGLEDLSPSAAFDVAHLFALFTLSACGARMGREGCGTTQVGRQVLSVAQSDEVVRSCIEFLRSRKGTDAKQNILVALSQLAPSAVVLENLSLDASSVSLWQRLLPMDYDQVWATFETLGDSPPDRFDGTV